MRWLVGLHVRGSNLVGGNQLGGQFDVPLLLENFTRLKIILLGDILLFLRGADGGFSYHARKSGRWEE